MPRDVVGERSDPSPDDGATRDVAPPSNEAAMPAATAALVVVGTGARATGGTGIAEPVHAGADTSPTGTGVVVRASAGAGAATIGVGEAPGSTPAVAGGAGRALATGGGTVAVAAGGAAASTLLPPPPCRAEYCHPAKASAATKTLPAATTSQVFDRAARAVASGGARRGAATPAAAGRGDAIAPG